MIVGQHAQLRLNFSNEEVYGWVGKSPKNKPPARFGHAISSINGTDKVLLFGGLGSINFPTIIYNDTWVYDYSENSWTNMSPSGENPPPTECALMTPIYDTDKVFLLTYNSTPSHRTWIYDLSDNNWTKKSGLLNISSNINRGGIASVFGTDKIIHFGGIGTNNLTWEYDIYNTLWWDRNQ
jgi:hypothetical protein